MKKKVKKMAMGGLPSAVVPAVANAARAMPAGGMPPGQGSAPPFAGGFGPTAAASKGDIKRFNKMADRGFQSKLAGATGNMDRVISGMRGLSGMGRAASTMKKGGSVKSSASKRADGIAQRGKTRGKVA